jgi:hypothetical protein
LPDEAKTSQQKPSTKKAPSYRTDLKNIVTLAAGEAPPEKGSYQSDRKNVVAISEIQGSYNSDKKNIDTIRKLDKGSGKSNERRTGKKG